MGEQPRRAVWSGAFPATLAPTDEISEISRSAFVMSAGMLMAIGTLMVYSSSMTSRPTDFEQIYLSRHLWFLAGAFVVGVTAAHIPARFWRSSGPLLMGATLLLLLLVMIPGIGARVNGAQRWIRWGGLSLQPSETAKLSVPLLMAAWQSRSSKGYVGEIIRVLAPVVLACILIAQEPDLGTASFVAFMAILTLFLARWPLQNFLFGGLAALPACVLLVALRPYQLQRIEGFLAVWRDFSQAPYQIRQSLTTLGSGGLTGTGLGSGWQKLSFLPEANTDFVFAVIGEELGLVGTAAVVGIWLAFLYWGMRVLDRLPRRSFEYVAGMALLTQIVLQAAVNVAVVTALLPPKGISHPFISYGGSNLMVNVAAVGIILSLGSASPEEVLVLGNDLEQADDGEGSPEWVPDPDDSAQSCQSP